MKSVMPIWYVCTITERPVPYRIICFGNALLFIVRLNVRSFLQRQTCTCSDFFQPATNYHKMSLSVENIVLQFATDAIKKTRQPQTFNSNLKNYFAKLFLSNLDWKCTNQFSIRLITELCADFGFWYLAYRYFPMVMAIGIRKQAALAPESLDLIRENCVGVERVGKLHNRLDSLYNCDYYCRRC